MLLVTNQNGRYGNAGHHYTIGGKRNTSDAD